MSNYVATGKPINGSRNISKDVRDEFNLIEDAVATKANMNSQSSISATSITIPASPPQTISFVMESDKEFVGGQSIYLADSSAPATNNMSGILLSYTASTGAAQVNVTSKNGSGTLSSWIIGISNPAGVTLGANTFTGAQNFARATVASAATTADIWNASGNQIDFTGTVTVTGFPAAPQAGATRELICAAACPFTAGANMLIDGIGSGSTVTCAANDVVIVRAVSLSQFRLTRQRYDGRPQKEVADNVVTVHTGNTHGSSSTMIRRYTTVLVNTGTAITYADSATLGASFTINEAGLYEIYIQDNNSSGGWIFGASLNSAQLTTSMDTITVASKILQTRTSATNFTLSTSRTVRLAAADIVRPHTDGSVTAGTTSLSYFSIRKIASV